MTRSRRQGTEPIWGGPEEGPAHPSLDADARADVCVIGAGAAGLSAAYVLAEAGKSVIILDDRGAGEGETRRSTAHLTSALDLGWAELERLHGPEAARLAAQSHETAIKRIAAIAARESLDFGLEEAEGYAYTADGRGDGLEAELAAARRAGLAVERLERAPLSAFDTGPCLLYPRQAQLDPGRYAAGLARAAARRGARLYAGERAVSVTGGDRAEVVTRGGRRVRAGAIVVATNSPFNDRVVVQSGQAARRTYAIAVEVPPGTMPRVLLWDDAEPYHYVRLSEPAGEPPRLIVGGEDHPTGRADDGEERWARLEAWTRERFAVAGRTVARWSGQIIEPMDGLAFIGRSPLDPSNIYVATGHSGNGITYGMIAGMLLGDMILGRPNDWEAVYAPGRVTPEALPAIAQRGLDAALQYASWAVPDAAEEPRDLARGRGAVLPCGLGLGAVYRDARGGLHELSPVCPHLGGRVRWNTAEASWDCPVHGSRFDAYGRALNGPAPGDLEKRG